MMEISYTDLVNRLHRGGTARDASLMLSLLIEQVRSTGRSGTMNLTLEVRLSEQNQQRALFTVVDDIKVSLPKPVTPQRMRAKTVVWFERGAITTDDEKQSPLFDPP